MSRSSRSRPRWTALLLIPLLFAAVAGLQTRIDSEMGSLTQLGDDLFLRSPSAIKTVSLGYESLLSDIYWTRTVQYYGGRFATEGATFPLLWPLLDITTTLDPQMIIAYRFGAIFLSESGTGGAGRPDLAVELVKRGIRSNPDDWRLNTDLGFLYYWRLRDYPSSASAFLDGSNKPNAPPWMKVMAARVAQKGGSLDTARMIWSEIYESNKDPKIRERALETLRGLRAEEDMQQLNLLADEYQKRSGRYPASVSDLRSAGLIAAIPVDPDGYPYLFEPDGKAALDPRSPVVIPKEIKTPPTPGHY
ncbi:MAG TPA: hypothetical protein VEJ45_10030 [Candidatus Acidoferrales bacterium]|nr:hypothetical protein [Candidatus Acidoferrales bacterium]